MEVTSAAPSSESQRRSKMNRRFRRSSKRLTFAEIKEMFIYKVMHDNAARFNVLRFVGMKDTLLKVEPTCSWIRDCLRKENHPVWEFFLEKLWEDKVYVPKKFQKIRESGRIREAYRRSWVDKGRAWLRREELVNFTWCMRFKKKSGAHWVKEDPFWVSSNENPHAIPKTCKVLFEKNGYSARADSFEFARGPTGGKFPWALREHGTVIQMSEFPEYIVKRHANWGFILDSCWVVYTSFPMPKYEDLSDESLEISEEVQVEQIRNYTRSVFARRNYDEEEYETDDSADVFSGASGECDEDCSNSPGSDKFKEPVALFCGDPVDDNVHDVRLLPISELLEKQNGIDNTSQSSSV